ncbi:MAG TPA: DUF4864 domain-containing protein [Anaerolineae bacterium]
MDRNAPNPGRMIRFWGGLLLFFILTGCSLTPKPATYDPLIPYNRVRPNPELLPDEVVQIQIEALQFNDSKDRGIEITFRFASPGNKRFTGPLPRFTQMLRNPLYRSMLNHKSATYEPINIDGTAASQLVTLVDLEGNSIVYLFALSKQSEPPCLGCWMTDSVGIIAVKRTNNQEG